MTRAARALARVNALGAMTMLALLGTWEALVRLAVLEYDYLPAPSAVAQASEHLITSGELAGNLLHTLTVTLAGWAAASLAGIALGILLGLSDTAWRYSFSSLEVIRAVPPVTLVPVALLMFGFSVRMELTLILFASAWPVLLSTIGGVRGARNELLDVSRVLHLSTRATLAKIVLPGAVRSIIVGLRLALSLSLVLAVVAEMLGNPSGLGHALVAAQQALQPEQMFVYVFAIGLLGVGLNSAFGYVMQRTMPWLRSGQAYGLPR
jgi:ABC-type nitrate/sulfonate/bicarbonate transport system permease component